jgi:plastocyanin
VSLLPNTPVHRRPLRHLLAVGAIAVVVAACGGNDGDTVASTTVPDDVGPPTADPVVSVVDNEFDPVEVVVSPGTTVTWRFEGEAAHDVSGDGFVSDRLTEGEFTHTFEATGSYPYVCTLHSGMDGTVYVTD